MGLKALKSFSHMSRRLKVVVDCFLSIWCRREGEWYIFSYEDGKGRGEESLINMGRGS